MDDNLPIGWESDYDASRWLYRYAPTGHVQFSFPKPGDEFPHFDPTGAGPITFTPEERSAYEQQLQSRREGMSIHGGIKIEKWKAGTKDHNFSISSTAGYFDPSGFMYFTGGEDDNESQDTSNGARYPLDVAELPNHDTMLCAQELAPIELDAGQYEAAVTIGLVGDVDEFPIASGHSPPKLEPASRPGMSVPPPGSPSTRVLPPHQHHIYSATPMRTWQDSYPTTVQAQHSVLSTAQAGPATPRFLVSAVPGPDTTKPTPRAIPRASVDDIKAMPSSLEPHELIHGRATSQSTSAEPWTPTITFVQTGLLQESQVSMGATAGSMFRGQPDNNSNPSPLDKVSEWLERHSFGEPPLELTNEDVLDSVPPEIHRLETMNPVRRQEHYLPSDSRSKPVSNSTTAGTSYVDRSGRPTPLAVSLDDLNQFFNKPEARVVHSVVEVPVVQNMSTPRGVQLRDISPGVASRGLMLDKGQQRRKQKRFSWEDEADDLNEEPTKEYTSREDTMPVTPTRPLITTQAVAERGRAVFHTPPRTSPLPSPRLPLGGKASPFHGRIAPSRGVLVESVLMEPSTAIVETFDKPLPPVPHARKKRPNLTLTLKGSNSTAFEQMADVITVTNTAVPSARRLTAIAPNFASDEIRDSNSSSALGSPILLAPQSFAVRSSGENRSISQQTASVAGLKPSARRRNRSQASVSPLESSPLRSLPACHEGDSPQAAKSDSARASAREAKLGGSGSHRSQVRLPPNTGSASKLPTAPSSPKQLPILQVKVPSHSGLSSSPRPSPRFKPKLSVKASTESSDEEPEKDKSIALVQTVATHHATERRPSESTVSSPSSSVFSTLPDSVSATSSMADPADSPLTLLAAELVALEKNQAQLIRQHRGASPQRMLTIGEQMPIDAAQMLALASSLGPPTPAFASSERLVDEPFAAHASVQRPANIPFAIRPAGTRAHPWNAKDAPFRPPIPTLVVRAPTVRLTPQQAAPGRQRVRAHRPPSLDMSSEVLGEDAFEVETPHVVDPEATPVPVVTTPLADALKTPNLSETAPANDVVDFPQPLHETGPAISISLSDNVAQGDAPSSISKSFLQSLRQSWQATSFDLPQGVIAPRQDGHTRAQCQSTLQDSPSIVPDAFAMVKQQPVTAVDRDSWRRESAVDVNSISNIGAAVRFFNSSFQSLRPDSEAELEPPMVDLQPEPGLSKAEPPLATSDIMTTTILMRRRGPPVVVRVPSRPSSPMIPNHVV